MSSESNPVVLSGYESSSEEENLSETMQSKKKLRNKVRLFYTRSSDLSAT